jgi:hypothetical protein
MEVIPRWQRLTANQKILCLIIMENLLGGRRPFDFRHYLPRRSGIPRRHRHADTGAHHVCRN